MLNVWSCQKITCRVFNSDAKRDEKPGDGMKFETINKFNVALDTYKISKRNLVSNGGFL